MSPPTLKSLRTVGVASALAVALGWTASDSQKSTQSHVPASTAVMAVSRNVFPASRDCRYATQGALDCPNPEFTSFSVSYPIGASPKWSPTGSLRLAFAYMYDGTYMTDQDHVMQVGWPELQTNDPTAPNFVSLNIPGKPRVVSGAQILTLPGGTVEITLSNGARQAALVAGDEVIVTFGDMSMGSPGYAVPALAYDIDLVLEGDEDGDGTFRFIDATPMRVVATNADCFEIVAPSTPATGSFDIILKVMQGEERPDKNMYLVPGYSGTVRFSSTDDDAVLPGDYTFRADDEGVARFSVTLPTPGVHTLTVAEVGGSLRGKSNPVVVHAHGETDKRVYWATLQQHTNIGGHATQSQDHAYHYAREVSGLDVLALTEHCLAGFDWAYSVDKCNAFNDPGKFVTFGAFEWSSKRYGHRHVIMRDAVLEKPYCDRGVIGPPEMEVLTELDKFLEAYRGRDVIIVPHHTGWKYRTELRQPSDDVVLGDKSDANQILFEIYSHHGSSESYDNEPFEIHGDPKKSHQWGPEKKVYFQDAIAQGYRFGVTGDGDNHTGEPGGHVTNSRQEGVDTHFSRNGITGIYAEELTRDGIWEALRARRTYGTTGARIILDFHIDDAPMGAETSSKGHPILDVDIIGTDVIRSVEIFRNGYDAVHEVFPKSSRAKFTFKDTGVASGEEYAYYVRVIQEDDHYAWSSPIWVRVGDAEIPAAFKLESVHPNPFNPSTTVRFSLPERSAITAAVWSVDGGLVRELEHERTFDAGSNEIEWDGRDGNGNRVASGVYFVRVSSIFGRESARVVLLK